MRDSNAGSAPQPDQTVSVPASSSNQAKWGISLAVILGSLTTSIMGGTVNVALPTMMTSLRAEVDQIQWVLTAFMITRTVMMPTLGWAGGFRSRGRYFSTVDLATSMPILRSSPTMRGEPQVGLDRRRLDGLFLQGYYDSNNRLAFPAFAPVNAYLNAIVTVALFTLGIWSTFSFSTCW